MTDLRAFTAPDDSGTAPLGLPRIAKFPLLTASPLAAIALVDNRSSGEDGARVALAAWVAPAAFCSGRCGVSCMATIAAMSFPFVANAAIGHAMGAWQRPGTRDF